MKKIYSTLALAAVVSLSASAEKNYSQNLPKEVSQKTVELNLDFKSDAQKEATRAPKKIKSIDELYGFHRCNYEGMLSSNEGPQVMTPKFMESDKGGNNIIVTNFPFTDIELDAIVDLEKGTFTIPRQDATYNSYYGEMMIFTTENAARDNDGNLVDPEKYPDPVNNALTGVINEDGSIDFPGWYMPCVRITDGYFWAGAMLKITNLTTYSFVDTEWDNCGTADFTDGWITPVLGIDQFTYTVDLLRNKKNDKLFALKNPYGNTTPFGQPTSNGQYINATPDAAGYIVFDLTNTDCVTVRPLVESGFSLDNSEEEDGSELEQLYLFNIEGFRYYELGESTLDIVDEVYTIMDDDEDFSDYLSTYDNETGVLSILASNSYFSIESNPLGQYYWQKKTGEKDKDGNDIYVRNSMPTTIKINDISAVRGLAVENAEVPVKYFNLQGMEVANPEAGQLVIKKQGSKATKIVVR